MWTTSTSAPEQLRSLITSRKQQKNQISKEEAQRILEALKNNEAELQKELRKKKGKPTKKAKDW